MGLIDNKKPMPQPPQKKKKHPHQSAGEDSLDLDARRSGARLYLHLKSRRVPLDAAGEADEGSAAAAKKKERQQEETNKPSKLAFGVEGGFQPEGPPTTVETARSVVVLPQRVSVPLPCPDLPELVLQAAAAVDAATSATAAAAAEDNAAAWEEGERRVSRYAADLPQLEEGLGKFGRNVPPNPELWECEASGMKENLWLNLSTASLNLFFRVVFSSFFFVSKKNSLIFTRSLCLVSLSLSLSFSLSNYYLETGLCRRRPRQLGRHGRQRRRPQALRRNGKTLSARGQAGDDHAGRRRGRVQLRRRRGRHGLGPGSAETPQALGHQRGGDEEDRQDGRGDAGGFELVL